MSRAFGTLSRWLLYGIRRSHYASHTRQKHTITRPLQFIDCRYNQIGCKVRMHRGDMAVHELDAAAHLECMMRRRVHTELRCAAAEERCAVIQARLDSALEGLKETSGQLLWEFHTDDTKKRQGTWTSRATTQACHSVHHRRATTEYSIM